MHQLRGRVGRSYIQGFAYFFYSQNKKLSDIAFERLKTIVNNTNLGSGSIIALKDLELRGAGNLLGANQSGHIKNVGFDMFVRLVEQATTNYKKIADGIHLDNSINIEKDELLDYFGSEPTIELPIKAYIPESYITSDSLRLEMYDKIATSKLNKKEEIIEELQDRYGKVPNEVLKLFDLVKIKLLAKKLSISEISIQKNYLKFFPVLANIKLPPKSIYKSVSKIALIPVQKDLRKQVLEFLNCFET
jgi:transcription-repair coupling factor (superfamily II helicase)